MKKMDRMKTIQLVIFAVLAVLSIYFLLINPSVGSIAADVPQVKAVCIMLWLSLILSFLFIFLDFTVYGKVASERRHLKAEIHSDRLSKIANRASCDQEIEKYASAPLPENFVCVMLELSNIKKINEESGRDEGNTAIQNFAIIIHMAASGNCFVGRNGGNRYLAFFPESNGKDVENFLHRITAKVKEYNTDSSHASLGLGYGMSSVKEDGKTDIHELVALADQRVKAETV
ncbi:MAG: GGDEF domain-containing protein [Eubacterium sp.]|nr:GGDEF domain-containing protein [Eubacterium sp.]